MPIGPIVSAEYCSPPMERPGLFAGRPWVIYHEGALHESGKRSKKGMVSFETRQEADAWRALVLGPYDYDVPF